MTLSEIESLKTDEREFQNEWYDNPVTFQVYLDHGFSMSSDVDSATRQLITDWFGDRRCPYKFEKFFTRKLAMAYKYYLQSLRLDPTVASYDWFVEHYNEDLVELTFDRTVDNDTTTSASGSGSNTGSSSNTNSSTSSGNSTHKTDGDGRAITQARSAPMSASYTSTDLNDFTSVTLNAGNVSKTTSVGHGIANPMISNPSQTGDSYSRTETIGEDTNSNTVSGTATGSSSNTYSSTDSSTSNNDITEHSENVRKNISTGRHNKISNVIEEAQRVIYKSNAFEWLCDELNECFMLTY